MTRFTLPTLLALASVALTGANAQGDPEAATAQRFNQPTKSWQPWQPKPTYALEELPDRYMGDNRAGNGVNQSGWNRCAPNKWNQKSQCQTAWINSLEDWCIWGPPDGGDVGSTERIAVAYCTTNKHGTRLIPDGTITGAHFVRTSRYVQITGKGDFTKIGIPAGDDGGEMDSHGADDLSNPVGGIVYTTANPATNGQPWFVSEWTNFMSHDTFCLRACWGNDARARCQHIYDVLGCNWNIPASYDVGEFETCDGDLGLVQGVYDGSTFAQGDPVTPEAHPVPSSSNCRSQATISHGLLAGEYPAYVALNGPTTNVDSSTSGASTTSTSSTQTSSVSSSSTSTSAPTSAPTGAGTLRPSTTSTATGTRNPAQTGSPSGAAGSIAAPLVWAGALSAVVLGAVAVL